LQHLLQILRCFRGRRAPIHLLLLLDLLLRLLHLDGACIAVFAEAVEPFRRHRRKTTYSSASSFAC
jgi:hypothetical protein